MKDWKIWSWTSSKYLGRARPSISPELMASKPSVSLGVAEPQFQKGEAPSVALKQDLP